MDKFIIQGGKKLKGEVNISGFKNAILGLIPATLLANDKCIITNVPMISDVYILADIMKKLGADVFLNEKNNSIEIDTSTVNECKASYDMAKSLRASYYLLGAGLGRFGKSEVAYPGGCDIGSRPIDLHIKGFEALGSSFKIEHGIMHCEADKLIGDNIYMDVTSVGATINIILAGVMAEGKTVIENAAKEPHIVDVANFLNAMGADVRGAGTDVIRINGVKELHGCTYSVIPDQIEAGTYLVAAAATEGDVVVKNVIPKHLESITAKLKELGVEITEYDDSIRVRGNKKLNSINIKTLPYPGFPTDLQQPLSVLLTKANGTSIVTESIFEGRFKYVDELKRMGANIKVDGRTAIIRGATPLSSTKITATDLRAGAACVIAGLMADGETEVHNIRHVERGYENIVDKLKAIGADIKKVSE
ncbi:UDP-N-acetylglucosamine 1-carboxyvinyltransferase [Senegalia massiliensis]|uniref:UDP-N-acetylglucosamine 1-carboxyvinyltransferase n=1 Tax=Senegalia massiliensis TaxID=1720316 RepID=A0A845R1T9_9CLOT|nr:UDP-N-acetylglucosamine 1-carboxyvinyltransferase [Senegalia massiliensis]NBI06543.1 UDP-N-acetylglucosamine 1-carboxyvinyltransferase [Senegalia massiliensis]